MLAMEPSDQAEHSFRRMTVQVSCRFIGEQKLWAGNESPGQGDALLFATGKFSGAMVGALLESDLAQPARSLRFRLLPSLTAEQQGHSHVLCGRKFRQQVMKLPNETGFAIAKIRGFVVGQRSDSQVGAVYVTCGGTIKSAEDVQQGTFSSAGFAHDGDHFSSSYRKRQILKEHQVRCSGPENLLEAFGAEHCAFIP